MVDPSLAPMQITRRLTLCNGLGVTRERQVARNFIHVSM